MFFVPKIHVYSRHTGDIWKCSCVFKNFLKVFVPQTTMSNISSNFISVPSEFLFSSVVYKLIAMIIGVLGNITVIIYTIFMSEERTATSYLVGNLALADLLVCLTFYPIWMTEFILILLKIDSDQDLFCKLSRSTISAFMFASMAALFAITVDRYLYIVKPLRYPLIVTKRLVFLAVSCIWLTASCLLIVFLIYNKKDVNGIRGYCYLQDNLYYLALTFRAYLLPTLIIPFNIWILVVAEKQRKRIVAEIAVAQSTYRMSAISQFFHAIKAAKTFSIVVAVLTFCVLIPTIIEVVLYKSSCSDSCKQLWFVVFHYEFYGINSIVKLSSME